ncbi:MAG: hypothetical protein ABIH34_06755 [Nanoarchaeota archaeon]
MNAKLFLFIALCTVLVAGASAFPVGIVVHFPDGETITQCVHLTDDITAEDALRASTFSQDWQGSGNTAFLTRLEGIENDGMEAWSFWVMENDKFTPSQVGMGQYDLNQDEVFGLSYATFELPDFIPSPAPPSLQYEDVCGLEITNLKVFVDGDKDDEVDEDGGTISKVKPLSEVMFEITVKNIRDDEIDDVKAEITIFDVDGSDLEEESDESSISDGNTEKMSISFNFEESVSEETFSVRIDIRGDGDHNPDYHATLQLELEVDKDSYAFLIKDVTLGPEASCGGHLPVAVDMTNIGARNQDVAIQVVQEELEISHTERDITVESGIDENEMEHAFEISIPFTAKNQMYPFTVYITHEQETETFTRQVRISGCVADPTPDEDTADSLAPEQTTPDEPQAPSQALPVFVPAQSTMAVKESQDMTGILVIGLVLVLAFAAVILYFFIRK